MLGRLEIVRMIMRIDGGVFDVIGSRIDFIDNIIDGVGMVIDGLFVKIIIIKRIGFNGLVDLNF